MLCRHPELRPVQRRSDLASLRIVVGVYEHVHAQSRESEAEKSVSPSHHPTSRFYWPFCGLSYLEDDASGVLTVDGDIEVGLGVVLVGDRHDSSAETDFKVATAPQYPPTSPRRHAPFLPQAQAPTRSLILHLFVSVHNRVETQRKCVFVYVTHKCHNAPKKKRKGGRERGKSAGQWPARARRPGGIAYFFLRPTEKKKSSRGAGASRRFSKS